MTDSDGHGFGRMVSHRLFLRLIFFSLIVLTLGSVVIIMYQGPLYYLNQSERLLTEFSGFSRQLLGSGANPPSEPTDTTDCVNGTFDNILLVITFVDSSYETITQLERLYGKHFPNILYCGPSEPPDGLSDEFIVVAMQHGVTAYECLGRAIRIYHPSSYRGYLFIRNDLFLNYWKVVGLNRTRIWESAELETGSQAMFAQSRDSWIWWFTPWGLKACERAYKELISLNAAHRRDDLDKRERLVIWDVENSLNALLWNGRGTYKCYRGYSKLFYIPAEYATAFEQMSVVFQKNQVYMEIAVPTIIRMLELKEKRTTVTGVDIASLYGEDRAVSEPSLFWKHYGSRVTYIRPVILKSNSELLDALLSRLERKPDCVRIDSRQA